MTKPTPVVRRWKRQCEILTSTSRRCEKRGVESVGMDDFDLEGQLSSALSLTAAGKGTRSRAGYGPYLLAKIHLRLGNAQGRSYSAD